MDFSHDGSLVLCRALPINVNTDLCGAAKVQMLVSRLCLVVGLE